MRDLSQTLVVLLAVAAPVSVSGAEKITVPLVEGMILDLGNFVATVEARLKSFGPGFCATEISASDRTTSYLAPPLIWGEWQKIFEHTGTTSIAVSTDSKCDTDVLGEVRYFPPE